MSTLRRVGAAALTALTQHRVRETVLGSAQSSASYHSPSILLRYIFFNILDGLSCFLQLCSFTLKIFFTYYLSFS